MVMPLNVDWESGSKELGQTRSFEVYVL